MSAIASAKPEVFTRKASGLVRVMSPWSAMFYNILAMGVIFPWTYLWAPGSLPGGHLVWGILLAMLFELPIALVYVFLSTALPRSGGDYVFQSRVWAVGLPSRSPCQVSSSGSLCGSPLPAGCSPILALPRFSWVWVPLWVIQPWLPSVSGSPNRSR